MKEPTRNRVTNNPLMAPTKAAAAIAKATANFQGIPLLTWNPIVMIATRPKTEPTDKS